nr:S8 family serine peptidase [Lachnospiraceae bacterium]
MKNLFKSFIAYILILSLIPINTVSAYTKLKNTNCDYELPLVSEDDDYLEGQVIVSFKDNVKESKANKIVEKLDDSVEIAESYSLDDSNTLVVSSDAMTTNELIKELAKSDKVAYVEPNIRFKLAKVSNDSYSDFQWHLKDNISSDADIGYSNFGVYKSVSKDVPVVVVADTGVDASHEDLVDVMYTNKQYNTSSKTTSKATDNDGHGTMIAGIIAATINNNKGVAGIADAKILPICCVNPESGYSSTSDIIAAIQYTLEKKNKGANICAINLSLTGSVDATFDAQMSALNSIIALAGESGIITVCAAGNETTDTDQFKSYPGGLDNPYIINVGASNRDNKPASFSNYGQESVDVFAPGTDIFTSCAYNDYNPEISHDISYYDFENVTEGASGNASEISSANASSNASSNASADASSNSTLRIYTNSTNSSIHVDKNISFTNSA